MLAELRLNIKQGNLLGILTTKLLFPLLIAFVQNAMVDTMCSYIFGCGVLPDARLGRLSSL